MMSSLMPSEKYSCSGSPLMLVKGSTAMAGRSGTGSARGASVAAAVAPSRLPVKRKPLRGDRADQGLPLAAVADRLARGVDAAGERRFGDDAAVPDRGDEIVLADHAVAVFDQEDQQIEDLRLQRNQRAVPPQLAAIGVKCMICKEKLHDGLAR